MKMKFSVYAQVIDKGGVQRAEYVGEFEADTNEGDELNPYRDAYTQARAYLYRQLGDAMEIPDLHQLLDLQVRRIA